MTTLIIVGILALVAGFIIARLLMKGSTVKRQEYDDTRDRLAQVRSQLDTKTAIEQELRQTQQQLSEELQQEKNINRTQQNLIATLQVETQHTQQRLSEEKNINAQQQQLIEQNNQQILQLKSTISSLQTSHDHLVDQLQTQQTEFEEARKKAHLEFENIANKIFEEKTTKFSTTSKEKIEQLITPLQRDLQEFKKKVEDTYEKEAKQRFSLEDRIKELAQLNMQISQDANNLTNALKGQVKTQGNWGEMILENILEKSGLVKGREYFTQAAYTDAHGRSKQPDVRIQYPDERYVIIDAKVSLTAYERYANADSAEEQKIYLAQHIQSIKNHVDNLSTKEYDQFQKGLDFVFLFIPIEPAFLTAIHYDNNLWNYAYHKRIVILSPTNLIATLRLIQDIWKREHQNQNAQRIATRGTRLYEKFVGFIQDMDNIGRHLNRAHDAYTDALNKLSTGRGHLIAQAEKLKTLGIQSKKQLPEKYRIAHADEEE